MTTHRKSVLAIAGTLALGSTLLGSASPANAVETLPIAGECFTITPEQARADFWPVPAPVPCTDPHTVEVISAGIVPAGTPEIDYAFNKCSTDVVLKYAGYGNTVNKTVSKPPRLTPLVFATASPVGDTGQYGYVCATGAFEWQGKKQFTLTKLTAPIPETIAADPAALHICAKGTEQDIYNHTLTSASCDSKNVWKVSKFVSLGKVGSKYPGEKAVNAAMRKACGYDATHTYTFPVKNNWVAGSTRGWCYQQYP